MNDIDLKNITTPIPTIGQPTPAAVCSICGSINPLDGSKPVEGKNYAIIGEIICPECRERLFELLYPEKISKEEKKESNIII